MRGVISFWVCLSLTASGCIIEDDDFAPLLDGYIAADKPIRYAIIEAYAVDPETGEVDYDRAIGRAESDERGQFVMELIEEHELVLLVGRSGYLTEYWHDRTVKLRESGHSFSLISTGSPDGDGTDLYQVTLSPLTSLVNAVARAHHDRGLYRSFHDAVHFSHASIYNHFIGTPPSLNLCESSLSCLRPQQGVLDLASEAGRKAMWMKALSAHAQEIAYERQYAVEYMNTIALVDEMYMDVHEDAIFNGVGGENIGPNALRGDLGNSLLRQYIKTPENIHSIEVDRVYGLIRDAANNQDSLIFGSTPVTPVEL